MTICPDYCGVSCVDGSCPRELRDKNACDECKKYKGCEDCYFKDNPDCPCPMRAIN